MLCVNLRSHGSHLMSSLLGRVILCLILFMGDAGAEGLFTAFSPVEVNGFVDLRAGCRIQDDSNEDQASVMESRLQVELFTDTSWAQFKVKADAWADGITEKGEFEAREAWVFGRPLDAVDIKMGRQVLTWGTGDLVFLNDLFPKDWQSYFIGRDSEYLKAPSDAVKFSFFTEFANLDLVYTPQFDPDRYITGEYISYWDGTGLSGQENQLFAQTPDQWFEDDELALRLYKNVKNYELALYGYHGFWKQPAGLSDSGEYIFPKLSALGFSARGSVGQGIGNIEFAYYRSQDDTGGTGGDSERRLESGLLRTPWSHAVPHCVRQFGRRGACEPLSDPIKFGQFVPATGAVLAVARHLGGGGRIQLSVMESLQHVSGRVLLVVHDSSLRDARSLRSVAIARCSSICTEETEASMASEIS